MFAFDASGRFFSIPSLIASSYALIQVFQSFGGFWRGITAVLYLLRVALSSVDFPALACSFIFLYHSWRDSVALQELVMYCCATVFLTQAFKSRISVRWVSYLLAFWV